MRKPIDTAPRNGDFVFLEDAARGTIAVARWSAEAAQWLDEEGTPSQLNATHWHSPQNLDEEATPSQLNAAYWHPLTPAQGVVETVDELCCVQPRDALIRAPFFEGWLMLGRLLSRLRDAAKLRAKPKEDIVSLAHAFAVALSEGDGVSPEQQLGSLASPSKPRIHRGASRPTSAGMTAQPQRVAEPGRSVNVWALFGGFAGRGCGKILSAFAVAGGWIVHSRRSIATMAACLLVAAAFGPLLYRSDLGEWVLHRTALEDDTGLKQALRQEQERANKLASDVTAARREAESQAALIGQSGEASGREKAASERTLVELRQALQLELAKTDKLAGQLAEAQRDSAAQTALTGNTIAEAARAEGESQRVIGELRQALKQQEGKIAHANVRPAEQLALKQERDKAEKLRVELAAARREAESQAAILRSASDEATRLKEASARATDELRQAQDKAEKLAGELAAARQEVEAQTTAARAASDEARRAAETNKRSTDEQGQALREAQGKAQKLTAELAAARQEVEAQTAVARAASDEARRAAETSKQSADEQGQALREAQGEAKKFATELAAAQLEVQSQVSVASSARDQAAGAKEAAERGADEQRRALQQERDRTEKLATELAETKSSLETQAKAKAAEEAARDNQLQKAKAEATAARESLEAERTRTQQVEQQLAMIQATTTDRGGRSPAAEASSVGQLSASSVREAPPKAPTEDVQQPTNLATRPTTGLEQGSPQAVRLIARANLLLEQGNIGAARNMLDRAADMGSTEALFWLAETYDPLLLSARQTIGTQSDIAKARELYGKALAGGVSQAKARLEALQQ